MTTTNDTVLKAYHPKTTKLLYVGYMDCFAKRMGIPVVDVIDALELGTIVKPRKGFNYEPCLVEIVE